MHHYHLENNLCMCMIIERITECVTTTGNFRLWHALLFHLRLLIVKGLHYKG